MAAFIQEQHMLAGSTLYDQEGMDAVGYGEYTSSTK